MVDDCCGYAGRPSGILGRLEVVEHWEGARTPQLGLADAATVILAAINLDIDRRGHALVVWSGGASPRRLVPYLGSARLDWSKVTFLLSDERWVTTDAIDSNEGEMRRYFLSTPMAAAKIIGLYSPDHSVEASVSEIAARIQSMLQEPACISVLGIGDDGHIASLFPKRPWVEAAPETLVVADCIGAAGKARISLSPTALRRSRQWLIFVNSEAKLKRWECARNGAQPSVVPAALAFAPGAPKVALIDQ